MTASREQLLGYLLNALEADEQAQVETDLEHDQELLDELMTLRTRLLPLQLARGEYEPPEGLAQRTCDTVARHAENNLPSRRITTLPARQTTLPARQTTLPARQTILPARETTPAVRSRSAPAPAQEGAAGSAGAWTLSDIVVAAGIAIAALIMFAPALLASRELSNRLNCQNNLRDLGLALAKYSDMSTDLRFPQIPEQGPQSFAGVVGPLLQEGELLPAPEVLSCPSSQLAGRRQEAGWKVPTLAELNNASPDQLPQMQKEMLGGLGYTLGVMVEDRYQAPLNRSRPHFVLMADAPRSSATLSGNHGAKGQNMLFEDNHVDYVIGCEVPGCSDNAFRNRQGRVAPGVGVNDSVVGGSDTSPFPRP